MPCRVLVVTNDPPKWHEWESGFQKRTDAIVRYIPTLTEAKALMDAERYGIGDLVLLDETVDSIASTAAARNIVLHNPLVSLALVSPLPEEAFHETTEGLGILCRLSPHPGASDAETLISALTQLGLSFTDRLAATPLNT